MPRADRRPLRARRSRRLPVDGPDDGHPGAGRRRRAASSSARRRARAARSRPASRRRARCSGISDVVAVGGAQAVAAMAFGTASVPRCDVIVGPGNAYVTEAKRQVMGARRHRQPGRAERGADRRRPRGRPRMGRGRRAGAGRARRRRHGRGAGARSALRRRARRPRSSGWRPSSASSTDEVVVDRLPVGDRGRWTWSTPSRPSISSCTSQDAERVLAARAQRRRRLRRPAHRHRLRRLRRRHQPRAADRRRGALRAGALGEHLRQARRRAVAGRGGGRRRWRRPSPGSPARRASPRTPARPSCSGGRA